MQTQNDTRKSSTFVARHDATQKKKDTDNVLLLKKNRKDCFPDSLSESS